MDEIQTHFVVINVLKNSICSNECQMVNMGDLWCTSSTGMSEKQQQQLQKNRVNMFKNVYVLCTFLQSFIRNIDQV